MAINEEIAVRYRIDPRQSQFTVQAFAEGLLSAFGHNPTIAVCGFGGDVRFVPGTLHQASLLMLMQAGSLAVAGDASEKDRLEIERAMREDVLEVARYPEIVFMSKSVAASQTGEGRYHIKITGSLSLHGVTRDHPIDADVTVSGDSLRARGESSLRQSDFNIKKVSVMGGTLKVKDEVKLSFNIVAERQG
jgi:polyisoprenoid-binding protein YceI